MPHKKIMGSVETICFSFYDPWIFTRFNGNSFFKGRRLLILLIYFKKNINRRVQQQKETWINLMTWKLSVGLIGVLVWLLQSEDSQPFSSLLCQFCAIVPSAVFNASQVSCAPYWFCLGQCPAQLHKTWLSPSPESPSFNPQGNTLKGHWFNYWLL